MRRAKTPGVAQIGPAMDQEHERHLAAATFRHGQIAVQPESVARGDDHRLQLARRPSRLSLTKTISPAPWRARFARSAFALASTGYQRTRSRIAFAAIGLRLSSSNAASMISASSSAASSVGLRG